MQHVSTTYPPTYQSLPALVTLSRFRAFKPTAGIGCRLGRLTGGWRLVVTGHLSAGNKNAAKKIRVNFVM